MEKRTVQISQYKNIESLGRVVGILFLGYLPCTATAQESTGSATDVFSAELGYSIVTDSNLFRRPDSANPRSDTINTASATLRFDKPVSLQRFQFEVNEDFIRYNDSSYLNFNATSYRGSWLWNPSQRFNLNLSASRAKALARFEDTLGTLRNVRVVENQALDADGLITGSWSWLLGVSRFNQKSEQAVVNQPDQRVDSYQFGVRYITPSGISISGIRRESKGDLLNQSAIPTVTGDSFKQNETELALDWQVSEKSELNGRIGRRERTNDQISQRRFSSSYGEIGYLWRPSSKLSFEFSASLAANPLTNPSFSYTENKGLSFAPRWQVTEKIATYMTLERIKSTYQGEGVVAPTAPARSDTTDRAEIGVDWLPTDRLSIRTSYLNQQRASNTAGFDYDADIASVSASWMF